MNESSVFNVFHPDAMDLFTVCSSLEKVRMYMYVHVFLHTHVHVHVHVGVVLITMCNYAKPEWAGCTSYHSRPSAIIT